MSDIDSIRGTEIYRTVFKEGYQEGFQKGRQETQQDMQRWAQFCRDTTLSVIQERFPDLVDQAHARLDEVVDLLQLAQLGLNISGSRTLEKAKEALEDGGVSRLRIPRQI